MNIEINGLNIDYTITGPGEDDAPTVVVLQGWGTHYSAYDFIASCINEKYRVVQFDFPGFGNSSEPDRGYTVDDYGDFFILFMQALKIQKATLLGHSYGGRVIIKLSSREELPFEITDIVLVDSAGILPVRTAGQKLSIAKFKALKKIVNMDIIYGMFPEIIDEWKSKQGSEDYRNASPIMKQTLVMGVNEDLTPLLPKIKQEVLLIWGEKDTATPLSDGKKMEEQIKNSGLAVMNGCSHFPFVDNPAQFRAILRSYFKLGV